MVAKKLRALIKKREMIRLKVYQALLFIGAPAAIAVTLSIHIHTRVHSFTFKHKFVCRWNVNKLMLVLNQMQIHRKR